MSWELFDKRGQQRTLEPRVTIQRAGVMTLNRAASIALGSPTHVVLLFDRTTGRMGVQKADKTNQHAYPYRRQGPSSSSISVRKFCQFWSIDLTETRRYAAVMEGDVLAIDLGAEFEVPARIRKPLELQAS